MNRAFSKIWIIVILIVFVTGGFFVWRYFGAQREEIKTPEEPYKKVIAPNEGESCSADNCLNIQELALKEECYYETALNCRNDNYCKGIESNDKQFDCYVGVAEVEGARKNNDPSQCWLYLAPYVNSACWRFFGMENWQTYKNDGLGYSVKEGRGFEFKYPEYFKKNFIEGSTREYFTVSGERPEWLRMEVDLQSFDGFEYENQAGAFSFRYDTRSQAWQPSQTGTPRTCS